MKPRIAYITNPIIQLKDYLTMSDQEMGVDVAYRYFDEFRQWVIENIDYVEKYYGDIEVDDPEDLDHISPDSRIFDDFRRYYLDSAGLFGEEAPSYLFLDYRGIVKNQWLIHFTSDAHSIAESGFIYGMDTFDRLGLTTYYGDSVKQYGGYNFAYKVEDFARHSKSRGGYKYGKEAVLFRASGVEVWHHGDEEPQVIFFGNTARDIVPLIETYDGWCAGAREVGCKEDLEDLVWWVVRNFNQYRKALT